MTDDTAVTVTEDDQTTATALVRASMKAVGVAFSRPPELEERIALALAETRERAEAPLRKQMAAWCIALDKERMASQDEINKWKDAWAKLYNTSYEARIAELEAENKRLGEALTWCSGSSDFALEGKARVGWEKLCEPLLIGNRIGWDDALAHPVPPVADGATS